MTIKKHNRSCARQALSNINIMFKRTKRQELCCSFHIFLSDLQMCVISEENKTKNFEKKQQQKTFLYSLVLEQTAEIARKMKRIKLKRTKKIIFRPLIDPELTRTIGIVTKFGTTLSPMADQLLSFLKKEIIEFGKETA